MTFELPSQMYISSAKVVEHMSYIYACRNCEKNEVETPIITAPAPQGINHQKPCFAKLDGTHYESKIHKCNAALSSGAGA